MLLPLLLNNLLASGGSQTVAPSGVRTPTVSGASITAATEAPSGVRTAARAGAAVDAGTPQLTGSRTRERSGKVNSGQLPKKILIHGNSIFTNPGGGTDVSTYLATLRPGDVVVNISSGGNYTQNMLSEVTSSLVTSEFDSNYECWLIGVEELDSIDDHARTAAQEYADWQTYVTSGRSAGFKVMVGTNVDIIEPVSTAQDNAWRAERLLFAQLMRANHSWADGFLDLKARAEFNDPNNATYYQGDKIHPTAAAASLMAQEMDAELTSPLRYTAKPVGARVVRKSGGASDQVTLSCAGSAMPKPANGAGTDVVALQPAGARTGARSGAEIIAQLTNIPGVRSLAMAAAATLFVSAQPAGNRSGAVSGAAVDSSSVAAAPTGTRTAERSGAAIAAAQAVPAGSRSGALSGAAQDAAGVVSAPSGTRSGERSGAGSELALAATMGTRSGATAGASADPVTPQLGGSRAPAAAGAGLDVVSLAPTGARAPTGSGAPLAGTVAALAGSRSLARSGAQLDFAATTSAPSGSRTAERSGAFVGVVFSASAGSRGLAVSGSTAELSGTISAPSGTRTGERSGPTTAGSSSSAAGTRAPPAGNGSSDTFPIFVATTSRAIVRNGAPVDVASYISAPSGARSAERSGDGGDVITLTAITITGSRSLARSGVLVAAAPTQLPARGTFLGFALAPLPFAGKFNLT